ncbi:WhiB family transcriptional regulator [Streptomyces erythrochromogenes]|uniref:WhiB family transcriptional regulator n=1 Tax=Streptomyces erythrochromogenes TaxID=285574 RepID=A0ABZ1QEL5_9ACTN|nr:WhiB family transcriptional regulator [Streptomyces erythrochromogenes]
MPTLVTNRRSRPHADSAPDAHWQQRAACVGRLLEFESSEAIARAMCGVCPVKGRCLDEALLEEGAVSPAYRDGVRGGLNPTERAALTGYRQHRKAATGGHIAGDIDEAERLLQAGELSDQDIARRTGLGRDSVGKLRRSLHLLPAGGPQAATPQEALERRTRAAEDGHLLWVGSSQAVIGGRKVKGTRLAFELGYGRQPEGRVDRACGAAGCVAWPHLTDSVLRRAARALPAPVEYLYGIQSGHWDREGDERWVPARVIRFPILKKTARRIYYAVGEGAETKLRSVDRAALEAEGEICRSRMTGWWEPDKFLYLEAPTVGPAPAPAADLGELRAAMTAAHPDRGGSVEAFTAAHAAYAAARALDAAA